MTVFVDSGGWLSAVNKADQYHERGRRYFEGLISMRAHILTTDFVLDEVLTRLDGADEWQDFTRRRTSSATEFRPGNE